jgi:hypothetical protein
VFDHFPKYNIKIVVGGLSAALVREGIFKLTGGNESLHEDSDENVVKSSKCCHIKRWLLSVLCSHTKILVSMLRFLKMVRLTVRLIAYWQVGGDGIQVYSMYSLRGTDVLIIIW